MAGALLGCADPPEASLFKSGALQPIRDGELVRVEGTDFLLGERPFRFVGANVAAMHGAKMRDAMPRLVRSAARDRIRVLRVWALGEAPESDEEWRGRYSFRLGPDGWVEDSFVHLDRLLAAAREHSLRVIIVLANRWGDYGGLSQYARWMGMEPHRRNLLHAELAQVLSDPRSRALYRAHAERIVSRVNTVTGVAYRDDPTIMAWELINELNVGTCAAAEAVRDWVAHMSDFVRGLDPNHLIAAGHIGYHSTLSRDSWRDVHALPNIDYADYHVYPQNVVGVRRPDQLGAFIADHSHLARNVLRKPVVVGEIGFPRGDAVFADRALWFDGFLRLADRSGTAGVLAWIYRPWDELRDDHGIWPWGPLEQETRSVRAVLKGWSTEWGGAPAEVVEPAILGAAPDDVLQPLDPRSFAVFTEGEWSEAGSGRRTVRIDPWALAEGCAPRSGPAWARWVIETPRAGAPSAFRVTRLGPERAADSVDMRVEVDGVVVGHYRGSDGFVAEEDALADAFVDGPIHFVRLSTTDPASAALLRRYTAGPVAGDDALELQLTWR